MNCLLVAATANEIEPFLQTYRSNNAVKDIDILITGVGLTAATYTLTKQITIKRPALIIQAGIAGCFDKNIRLGSVVVVTKDTIADLGVIENKQLKTMFDLGLIKPTRFPFNRGWLVNPHKEWVKRTKLRPVNAVSVNQVTTGKQMISLYRDKFQPAIESMEGAALHYTALLEKVPFLQLRSISNYIGERNKKNWKLKEAIVSLSSEIARITNHL